MPRAGGSGGTSNYTAFTKYGLVIRSGSGTNADPYKGYYWYDGENFDSAVTSCVVPIPNGWFNIKQASLYYFGDGNVKFTLKTSITKTAGSATALVVTIGTPQLAVNTTDYLVWEGLDFSMGFGPFLVPGMSYYVPPQILVAATGYAATDDFVMIVEMEWSEEEIY